MPKTVGESSIPENGSPYPGFYVQPTPTFSITNAIYVILSGIIAVVYIHRHITTITEPGMKLRQPNWYMYNC